MGMSVLFQLKMITRLVTCQDLLIYDIERQFWIRFYLVHSRIHSSFVSMNWLCDYCEDTSRRLERVMAEMDSLQAWEIESQVKTVLLANCIQDLSTLLLEFCQGLRWRVQLAHKSLGTTTTSCFLKLPPTIWILIIEWLWLSFWNFLRRPSFITLTIDFLETLCQHGFSSWSEQAWEYQGNYQDYVRLKAEQDERDATLLHKKEQLSTNKNCPGCADNRRHVRPSNKLVSRFSMIWKRKFQRVVQWQTCMNFEKPVGLGKVSSSFRVSFLPMKMPILQDFNLLVQVKDRIGESLGNGVGKSTLLNLFAGSLLSLAGQVVIGGKVRTAYISLQIVGLDEKASVINYLCRKWQEVKTSGGSTTSIAVCLEQFLSSHSTHGTLIEKLSGGEKKRLYLLKLLLEKPNVLLLDEPTNDTWIAQLWQS